MRELFDKALGAYLGFAIGDALGATVEFMRPREIALQHGVHREIVGGGWLKLARGQVTDDTTMSLALGAALLQGGSPALSGFAHGDDSLVRGIGNSYVQWFKGKPVDCGNTCRRGILRFLHEGTLEGAFNPGDGGNGALMRNLPSVLATLDDDAAFARLSIAQARLTHHHPLSDAATLGLGRLLGLLLAGADLAAARLWTAQWVTDNPAFGFTPYRGRATAYVVDTVQTVLHYWTLHDDFEDALVATVNQGDDADTTGALVGMLAGAHCGASRLPQRWLHRLQPNTVQAITNQTSGLLALARTLRPSLPESRLPEPPMPLFDYHCQACGHDFETLVRSGDIPACPQCQSTALEKCLARIAPAGKIEAIRMAHRRVAAAQGHFDHYSPSDKARLLQGKKNI